MQKDPLLLSSYDYDLPAELIASTPVSPRETSKLLIYRKNSGEVIHDYFYNIQNYVPKEYALFFNDTKVIKARILGQKESGGKVEFFYEKRIAANRYRGLIKGRVKVGTVLVFEKGYTLVVQALNPDNSRDVAFFHDAKPLDEAEVFAMLESIGHIPLPSYIKRADDKADATSYQSVFGKNSGALAAPTASLHFSEALFENIRKEYETYFLTLHVGLGTFLPVSADNIKDHAMHSEFFSIPKESREYIQGNGKILSIGTTALRTIEYFHTTGIASGECDIFLNPTNPPKRIDALLTNFHLPKSTLIMLVSSIIGLEKCLELYEVAKKERYRFYSYGDAMLII